jgi:surfeit locus 1 family protein
MTEAAPRKGLLAPVLFALAATALLVSLGIWQLHRLTWKEALIARIAAETKASPQPLPDASTWATLNPDAYDYRHVTFRGRFDNAKEVRVFYTAGPDDQGPGYLLLTPLALSSGETVIVNRGFVPAPLATPPTRPQSEVGGEVTVTGLMRPPQARNLFTPPDDPANGLYFSRDPAPIAAHFGLQRVAPFIVDADKTAIAGGWPEGGLTTVNIPNNHMDYALTWFGLAVGLWMVVAAYIIRTLQENPAKSAA